MDLSLSARQISTTTTELPPVPQTPSKSAMKETLEALQRTPLRSIVASARKTGLPASPGRVPFALSPIARRGVMMGLGTSSSVQAKEPSQAIKEAFLSDHVGGDEDVETVICSSDRNPAELDFPQLTNKRQFEGATAAAASEDSDEDVEMSPTKKKVARMDVLTAVTPITTNTSTFSELLVDQRDPVMQSPTMIDGSISLGREEIIPSCAEERENEETCKDYEMQDGTVHESESLNSSIGSQAAVTFNHCSTDSMSSDEPIHQSIPSFSHSSTCLEISNSQSQSQFEFQSQSQSEFQSQVLSQSQSQSQVLSQSEFQSQSQSQVLSQSHSQSQSQSQLKSRSLSSSSSTSSTHSHPLLPSGIIKLLEKKRQEQAVNSHQHDHRQQQQQQHSTKSASQKKKFDLQESLKRPLPYKPYTGPLSKK